MMGRLIYIWIFFVFFSLAGKAQDFHFSQWENSIQNTNPALTGAFDGDLRFLANYRNQWANVPVPYLTFSGFHDRRIEKFSARNRMTGIGGFINYDEAGDSRLSWFQLGGTLSQSIQIMEGLWIMLGVEASLVQRSFEPNLLTFDNQFNGDVFDPLRSIGESFGETRSIFFDLSSGANFLMNVGEGHQVNLGFSFFHMNTPKYSFLEEDYFLEHRFAIYAQGKIVLNERMQLLPSVAYQETGTLKTLSNEVVPKLIFRTVFGKKNGEELSFDLGFGARIGDALIGSVGLGYGLSQITVSYDGTISDFDIANQGRGGIEVGFSHIIQKIKPINPGRPCPIF